MNRNLKKRSDAAFTLIEILVASVVFSLFLTGLFSLYRMGTRMYVSGGWKLERQKHAERFLNGLRERMEQGSSPVEVLADGSLAEGISNFVMVNPGSYTYRAGAGTVLADDPALLMAFPVCKPSLGGATGVIMYNMVRASRSTDGNNLMTLEFLSTPDINTGIGQNFVTGSAFDFFATPPDLARFSGNPADFGIGPTHMVLNDVLSVAISTPPIPAALVASDSLVRLDIAFEHPKYPATQVLHSMTTSVEITLDPGGL